MFIRYVSKILKYGWLNIKERHTSIKAVFATTKLSQDCLMCPWQKYDCLAKDCQKYDANRPYWNTIKSHREITLSLRQAHEEYIKSKNR